MFTSFRLVDRKHQSTHCVFSSILHSITKRAAVYKTLMVRPVFIGRKKNGPENGAVSNKGVN